MKTKSIEVRLRDLVANQLNVKKHSIVDSSHFMNDLGADSLDTVELVMAVEEEFKDKLTEEIPESDVEKLQTFGQVVAYIKNPPVRRPSPFTLPLAIELKEVSHKKRLEAIEHVTPAIEMLTQLITKLARAQAEGMYHGSEVVVALRTTPQPSDPETVFCDKALHSWLRFNPGSALQLRERLEARLGGRVKIQSETVCEAFSIHYDWEG